MESNFNQPQRQSLVGILVIFLEMVFQVLKATWPIIVITLLKANTQSVFIGSMILLGMLAWLGIYSYLNYRNFTFYIDEENEEFIVSDGIINKTKTTIQLHKIQQVNIKQNLIQRFIGVYALDVDTAGSDKKEGNIKAISHDLALALKSKLLENEGTKVAVTEEVIAAEKPEYKAIPFLKINLGSLLKIGITSNYVKSVGLILTFFFTIYENLHQAGAEDVISTEKLEGFVDNNSVWYSALVFILIMFTVVFLINILRTIIKFFDYTVTKQKGSLMLTYGLINTQSTILKPEKVQIVKISSNYFQKKLNVLEIKIRQAISNEKKDNKSLIEIPGCNTTERDEILKLLFKQLPEKGALMQPNFRKLIFSVFIIIVLPLTGYFLFGKYAEPIVFDYANIAVFYTIFMSVLLFFGFRNYRLFVNDNHIIKQSGAWDVDHEIIEIGKIQAITTSQLFWHKSLNIGSLTMHTAGGNITFHLGQFDKINEYVNLWLYEIETSNSNWM
ncbi:PH domain-containing protein [Flavobacterium sp. IMCC34852]|uniref:PH domain-containing protein n=1 Tax=Flavobacterium rivulicola TaxID=2732161 RepID=A0A7Y3R8A1_9FLAO|nr:PH domain-containing protein [Flavobacterium sp. IMCC34852]NNT71738.1 PH domain-containing protein [Flavobacterium sp. IMCC34852]